MTNETLKTPDVNTYMELARSGDIEAARAYLVECFGEGDAIDKDAVAKFQVEVDKAVAAELEAAATTTEETKEDSNESAEVQETTTEG
jgi:hypothetical protein